MSGGAARRYLAAALGRCRARGLPLWEPLWQPPPARVPRALSGGSVAALSLLPRRHLSSRNRLEGKVLETVGVFEAPKQHGKYETGQLFLHSVFGYRGIVLFPWQARLYDRDVASPVTEKSENAAGHGSKEVKGKTHTYYQVLIDARDCPHISQRSQTEAVTFLANHDDSRALYAIPGLDYVSHEDILPYSSTDQVPIQHELFERFLMYDQTKVPPFVARDTLCAWQEKNHPWLELSDVHRETTENIRVTVIPFYMGMREAQNSHVYWWRYCIRLENLDSEVVQLRERHWRIFSLSGTLETVRGRGVVGRPVLSKEQPAFQYSSHVSLQASSGHIHEAVLYDLLYSVSPSVLCARLHAGISLDSGDGMQGCSLFGGDCSFTGLGFCSCSTVLCSQTIGMWGYSQFRPAKTFSLTGIQVLSSVMAGGKALSPSCSAVLHG
uniref:DNA polymerase delta interacting protein 2 n=1 Tax=Gallus gallus TaxID=9031 RepID=A0A8V1AM26_CHICK